MGKPSRRFSNIGGFYKKDVTDPRAIVKVGRNELCPCGSGEKYKRCCDAEDLGALERWWRGRKIKKILRSRSNNLTK